MTHDRYAKDFSGDTLLSLRVTETASDDCGEIGSRAIAGSVYKIRIASYVFDVVKNLYVRRFCGH